MFCRNICSWINYNFATTSCSCSSAQEVKSLPAEVYEYDQKDPTILTGFKPEFWNDSTSPIYWENFQDCDTMLLPSGIKAVSDYAFQNHSTSAIPDYITKIIFNKEVTSIGDYSFSNSVSLTSIEFKKGSNIKKIGEEAFCYSLSLTSIILPNSLEEIGKSAFRSCLIPLVKLPTNLKTINDFAFKDCPLLTSVDFSKCVNLSSIGDSAFNDTLISSLDLYNCDSFITVSGFENCSTLTSVIFPKSCQTIGQSAFEDCASLSSITISDNLDSINKCAFVNCSSLANIQWDLTKNFADISIGGSAFEHISNNGILKCTSTQHQSQDLLNWLQGKDPYTTRQGEFPTSAGWTAG